MNVTVNGAMEAILQLDSGANLTYSTFTGKWYVSAAIDVGGNGMLRRSGEHRDTPDEAVLAYFVGLKSIAPSEYLVTHATDTYERTHWRWDGIQWLRLERVKA